MARNTLPENDVRTLQLTGFDVYQRDAKDSYAYFTSGVHIGYIQYDAYAGYTLCTVHKPSQKVGTGFQIVRHAPEMTEKDVMTALTTFCPSWHRGWSAYVNKYTSWDEFERASTWNAGFKKREPVDAA